MKSPKATGSSNTTHISTIKSTNKEEKESTMILKSKLKSYQNMEEKYINMINKYEIVKRLLVDCEKKLDTTLKENQFLIKENEKMKEKTKKIINLNRQIVRKYGIEHEKCRKEHEGMINPFSFSKFQAGVSKKF